MEGQTKTSGSIGWAVAHLKAGGRVKRRRWTAMHLQYVRPNIQQVVAGHDPEHYSCAQVDLLADDWEEAP